MSNEFSWEHPFVRRQFNMKNLAAVTWDDITAVTKVINNKFPEAKLARGKVLSQIRKWMKQSPKKKNKNKLKKIPKPPILTLTPTKTQSTPRKPPRPRGESAQPPPTEAPPPKQPRPVFPKPPIARVVYGIPVYKPTKNFKLYSLVPPPETPAKKLAEEAAREASKSPEIIFSSSPSPVPCSSTDPVPGDHANGADEPERPPRLSCPKPRRTRPYKTRPFFFDPINVNADKITDFRFALTNALHKNVVYYAEDKNTLKVFKAGGNPNSYFCADCKCRATLRDGVFWVRYHKDPCPGRNREVFKQLQMERREQLAEKRAAGILNPEDMPGFDVLTEEEFDIEMPDYSFCKDWYYRSPTSEELMQRCSVLSIPFLMNMIKPDYQRLFLCQPSLIVHITSPKPSQCGYRALSLLLSGSETHFESLKSGLLSYLTSLDWNNDYVALYPNAIDEAKRRLENPDEEDGHSLSPEELTALAIVLHMHIFVFDADQETDQWKLYNFNLDQPEKMWYTIETGILLYHKAGQYNAILGLC